MKNIIMILVLLSVSISAQVKTFTLEESLRTGLQNSKGLKIAGSRVAVSDARINEASSLLLPKINFSASYTRLSEVPPFSVITPFSPAPIKLYDVISDNYTLKLSLQQPLFTGFRLSSLKKAADYNFRAAETEYEEEVNKSALQIYNAFWNYYKAGQIREVVEENLKQIERHLEDTRNFLKNGLVARNDLLKLEVQYSNIRLLKIDTDNNLDLAKISFNRSIGIELNSPTGIEAAEINPVSYNYNLQDIISEAKENRKELKSLELKIQAADENITAAGSGWFPSVFLFGNFYYSKPNQRILPPENQFNDTWDLGITLNWDLWNWGYTASQKSQAEESKIQAELSLSTLKETIEIEVYQAYLNYNKSLERLDVIQKSLEQSEENYRITNEKYNSQLATSSDLIDAEFSLLQAKTNLTNAFVDYELARIVLEKAVGRKIY